MKVNYHIHTKFSDGNMHMAEYVKEATRKRFDEIGFTDHLCLLKRTYSDCTMKKELIKEYEKNFEMLKKSSKGIKLKMGIEIDYFRECKDEIKAIIKRYKFDYVIGSVHYINETVLDVLDFKKKYHVMSQKEKKRTYDTFFSLVEEAASSGLFDIIAHLDLIKKFTPKPKNLEEMVKEALNIIKREDLCMEVNTSGLRFPCNETYPAIEILRIAYKDNIPITIGTDAHDIAHIEQGLSETIRLLKGIGFKKIALFEKRRRYMVNL